MEKRCGTYMEESARDFTTFPVVEQDVIGDDDRLEEPSVLPTTTTDCEQAVPICRILFYRRLASHVDNRLPQDVKQHANDHYLQCGFRTSKLVSSPISTGRDNALSIIPTRLLPTNLILNNSIRFFEEC